MRTKAIVMWLFGCLAVMLTVGCHRSPQQVPDWSAMRGETYTMNPPQAVFEASSMGPTGAAASETAASASSDAVPWWLYRNDARLNVRSGGARVSVTDFVILTADEQRSFGGEIRNHYRRERRSVEYGTLVR